MGQELGPHEDMVASTEKAAIRHQSYQDVPLDLLVSEIMDEIEPYLEHDDIDRSGFLNQIRNALSTTLEATTDGRRREFLLEMVDALYIRLGQI